MWSIDFETMDSKRRIKIETAIKKHARLFYKEVTSGKKRSPYLLTRFMFYFRRNMLRKDDEAVSADKRYWMEQGWFNRTPF